MFDIDAYQDLAAPVSLDGVDFAAFRARPLSPDVLRCLRFMHDVESHTVCYLRDLLVTPSHADPRVTTFLTMWNYEEHWHGAALGKVLDAHGEPAGDARIGPMRARLGRSDRVAPILNATLGALLGEDFVAVHMTWGALNEWSTQAGYARLAERAGHPVLTELLDRIQRQEARHVAFYATEARRRLAASPRARRLVRWALKTKWAPVGSSVMPRSETEFLLRYLLDGPAGAQAIQRLDANVRKLPGLDGLHVVRGAATAYGVTATAPPEPARVAA
ncbi:MAG TPA: ferritin-like domain-containing protein [Frankiaceae bacterium]|nr:ferritin-like domain-containing protein [Frankiaceae bacterium]